MNEIWKDIKGYEGLYQISNLGRVKSIRNNKEVIRKIHVTKRGYFLVTFTVDYKYKTFSIHRLVAQAFINNPNNYKEINHKNSIKTDNNVENLEWCSHQQNNSYKPKIKSIKTLSKHKGICFFKNRSKPYNAQIQFNKKRFSLGYFKTEKEAAIAYNKKAKELFGSFAILNEVA